MFTAGRLEFEFEFEFKFGFECKGLGVRVLRIMLFLVWILSMKLLISNSLVSSLGLNNS